MGDNGKRRVVVVGGGYAGSAVAQGLDDVADVVLVEPKDVFVHNVAALRALVDPSWLELSYFPYDRLLQHGRVVQDRATLIDSGGVTLASGDRLEADIIVLSTGTSYPFPAKCDVADGAEAKERVRRTHKELATSDHVLLVGGGAVGIELAGEIKSQWPGKRVTIPAASTSSGQLWWLVPPNPSRRWLPTLDAVLCAMGLLGPRSVRPLSSRDNVRPMLQRRLT